MVADNSNNDTQRNLDYRLTELLKQKVISNYLRDERKYDKWGGLGKILLIEEVLGDGELAKVKIDKSKLIQLTNTIFPRTFACTTSKSRPSERRVKRYLEDISHLFNDQGIEPIQAWKLAWEETKEKFSISDAEMPFLSEQQS